jgi:hypothetical protein
MVMVAEEYGSGPETCSFYRVNKTNCALGHSLQFCLEKLSQTILELNSTRMYLYFCCYNRIYAKRYATLGGVK